MDEIEDVVIDSPDIGVETDEQVNADLLDRRTFIGGSDAPVIIGLSSWKSPFQLYLEKTGQLESPDISEIERVRWGVLLEDLVAREFSRRIGLRVRRMNNRAISKEYPWMVAQIDRAVVGVDAVLECKTTDAAMAPQWGPEESEEIPPMYYTQVQHQLMVTGKEIAYVAVLIGGNNLKIYTIKKNQEFIDALKQAEIKFWNQVQARIPPDPITPDEASLRWSKTKAMPIEGSPLHGALAAEYLALSEQMKALETRQEEIKLELQKALQDVGDTLTVSGKPIVSWKNQTTMRLDQKALKEELPEIAEKYTRPVESRVFRVLKGAKDFGPIGGEVFKEV